MSQETISVTLTHRRGYVFNADYLEGPPSLVVDESAPLGEGEGPNPTRLLATAVAHCLGSSLLFCLRKQHIEPTALTVRAECDLERNERGRLRIGGIRVMLELEVNEEERARMGRCLELFQDYCVVTESVRKGIPVQVAVEPPATSEVTCEACQPADASSPPPAAA